MIQRIGRWLRVLLQRDKKQIVVVTPPLPGPDNGVYITVAEARKIIKAKLNVAPHLADAMFYCPSVQYVEGLLEQDELDKMKYAPESFDCDDFAWILKARFCMDAYKNGQRRAAHAMGIIWGEFPHPHAINWVITDDKVLRLIEPQTDGWKLLVNGSKVYMMAG